LISLSQLNFDKLQRVKRPVSNELTDVLIARFFMWLWLLMAGVRQTGNPPQHATRQALESIRDHAVLSRDVAEIVSYSQRAKN
jgi:hypothetical protein